MLERKGIEHEVVDLPPGMHPILLRAAGFRGGTVRALRIDGRRIQGSVRISHALEQIRPEPALFPGDAARRRAVEEAEAWGEQELQAVPRRVFRWSLRNSAEVRRWMAGEVMGFPAPAVMATLNVPVTRLFARMIDADDAHVRADLAGLPAQLDRADALIAEGTIGAEEPNAADFQIGTTLRVLRAFPQLRPLFEGRPSSELASRVLPDFQEPLPAVLPEAWLPKALRDGGS